MPARPAAPHVVVLFGATGDLARRKLLPGLLHLRHAGLLPDCQIVGVSLDDLDDDAYRELAYQACTRFARPEALHKHWPTFSRTIRHVPLGAGPTALADAVGRAEDELGGDARFLLYVSTPPSAVPEVLAVIEGAGLVDRARIVMEKPFGTDLASAQRLHAGVHRLFEEQEVYRIDHFLGKEAALNILAFRFANGLFEPIWNRDHIDHVQIDVPETLGVDSRASFYEQTGAFRDMVVTHLLQVLAFMAMEPPTALEPGAISEEKV
ncbi:MAG: glucose-6-phosphate dehydrogenase, partial [Acidimicrobiales bacterium]